MTEIESKALEESIRLNIELQKLMNNKSFKEIILTGFIDNGIKGCMAALPFAMTDDSKKRLHSNLEAIAKLQAYFKSIENTAKEAQEALEATEEEVE